jgi:hypothetical protein
MQRDEIGEVANSSSTGSRRADSGGSALEPSDAWYLLSDRSEFAGAVIAGPLSFREAHAEKARLKVKDLSLVNEHGLEARSRRRARKRAAREAERRRLEGE